MREPGRGWTYPVLKSGNGENSLTWWTGEGTGRENVNNCIYSSVAVSSSLPSREKMKIL